MGAGAKTGFRATQKLQDAGHDLRALATAEAGRSRLAAGTMVLTVDAAAPCAGALPQRPDLTYLIGHPCQLPLHLADTAGAEGTGDLGGTASPAIVCALMQGPEAHCEIGAEVCRAIGSPVTRTHRLTPEPRGIREPGLSGMVGLTRIDAMAGAVDECAARHGIAREAAHEVMMGQLNGPVAMRFGVSRKVPADAALRVTRHAQPRVRHADWRPAPSPAAVPEGARLIVEGRGRP